MRIQKYAVFFIAFLFPLLSCAATAAQQLAQLLDAMHSLQAQFVQTVADGNGRVLQQTAGKMSLIRPGKFRWDTQSPAKQLLIADGRKIWLYDQDLQQVTVQKQQNFNPRSPAMLLNGSTKMLAHDFNVSFVKQGDPVIFKLAPKKASNLFQSVSLSFKNKQLQQMRMLDNLGQVTTIYFTQVRLNPPLPTGLFKFITPKGVDVVRE